MFVNTEPHMCGEIAYEGPEGPVHSDICIDELVLSNETIDFLHKALDEFLMNRNCGKVTVFYLGKAKEYLTEENDD